MRSTRRLVPLLLLAAVGWSAGCGDDGEPDGAIDDPVDAAEAGVTAITEADVLACQSDRTVLETAVEAYVAVQGARPTSDADLVAAGLLREESDLWDVAPDGSIVPAPDAGC